MSDDSFKAFMAIVVAVSVVMGAVAFGNANEVEKCASLRKQGVRVYVSEGLFSKQCEVIQRDVVQP